MTSLKDYPSQNNALGTALLILFWVGLVLGLMAIVLFANVALPLSWAIVIWLAPGIICTPFLYNAVPSQKLKGFSKAFVLLFASIIAFGGILLYLFLAVDYYAADDKFMSKGNYKVIETGFSTQYKGGGPKTPDAAIIYKNQEKWFNFSHNSVNDTLIYHSVQLETTPGALGFDAIKSWKLIK